MSHLVEQKKKFLMLLIQTREMISQKKRLKGWDYVIERYADIKPEKLEEKFRFNTLYLLEKIIEPELDSFRLDKINKHMEPKIKYMLKEMDRILTDQMSSILAKIYVANLLLTNKTLYIDELYDFIVQRDYNSCILHDLIKRY